MAGIRAAAEAGLILAIDQGTTSTRAMVFDREGRVLAGCGRELRQIYPGDGLVEHDAEEIWRATVAVCRDAVRALGGGGGAAIAAIGITNQRETTVIWDRATGEPIHNAIVWQDRRTAPMCRELERAGHGALIAERTGLILDPYFSATKIAWLLDHVDGARARAERGELAFGTIDSFLLWRLTGGRTHATDATNAARTQLFDIHRQRWDEELLALHRVPAAILPEVRDSAADFGVTVPDILGRPVPISGVAGDQQAATVGQACFEPGMVKSTYGTGCFALMNTGETASPSQNRLLTTVAYRLDGRVSYALEGSIFIAGAAVQWLRDGLKLIDSVDGIEELVRGLDGNRGVYMVPAFTGLGAPHWDADARGAIFGLTRDTGIAEIVRAALEAVCYQTRDLLVAMERDGAERPRSIRVDGGMTANRWMLQFLADIVDIPVERQETTETTALGAAFLAGLQAGLFDSLDDIAARWRRAGRLTPAIDAGKRRRLIQGWDGAVARTRSNPTGG